MFGMKSLKFQISQEVQYFIAGSTARVAAGTILMPVTVIKTRLEASLKINPTILNITSEILKTHGLKGLFSGWTATTFRDAPYAGLYFTLYKKLKSSMYSSLPAVYTNAISAAVAGLGATIITQPFDVLKTRMQLDPNLYQSFIKGFLVIVKRDGYLGLFNGIGPRLARKPLQSMITWLVYEEVLKPRS